MDKIKKILRQILGNGFGSALDYGTIAASHIDLSRISLIRERSTQDLSNTRLLEEEILPSLGFNDEKRFLFPAELYPFFGQGLRIWQYPNQFSKYMVHLSKFKISSYMEIGVRHGGTFVTTVEYLNKFNPIREAVAVDINDCPSILEYSKDNPQASFLKTDTTSVKFQEYVKSHSEFDLVLIDGDHDEYGCRNDYEVVKNKARILAFHDIEPTASPGVAKVWTELKESGALNYDFFEFRDQYKSVNRRCLGIGLAVKRDMPRN